MKDRFSNGFASGVVAGLVPLIINYSSRALGLSTLVWADFMGLFILGRRPDAVSEWALTILLQFALLGILGGVFALVLPAISSQRRIFKGAVFGAAVWFVLFALPSLLQMGQLEATATNTAVSNLIGALLWGMALAHVLGWIDNRVSQRV